MNKSLFYNMKDRISSNTLLVRSNSMIFSDVGGEVVVMDIESGKYFNFDLVTSRIWSLIEEPISFADICKGLQQEYEVSSQECQSDVRELLTSLLKDSIVSVINEQRDE